MRILFTFAGGTGHFLPPMGADQPLNAARAEAIGVARVLDAMEATPADIQRAATFVLSELDYRREAELIRDEIRALPRAEQAVELIVQLGRTARGSGPGRARP